MARPSPDLVLLWAPTNDALDWPYTWVDLSSRLRKATSSRGRQSELDTFKAGEVKVELNNSDRAFDPANASSPYAGQLARGRPLRLAVGYRFHVDGANPITYLLLDDVTSTFVDQRNLTAGSLAGSDISYGVQGPLSALTTGAVEINAAGTTTAITQAHNAAYAVNQNTFSIECWVRFRTAALNHTIWSKGYTTGAKIRVDLNGKVHALISSTGTDWAVTSGTPCSSQNATTWYHIVVTKAGTGAGATHIYVNGVDQTLSTNGAVTINDTAAAPPYWGAGYESTGPFTYGNYLLGRMAHLAYFTRALTAAEVLGHYNSQASPQAAVFTGFTEELPQVFTGYDSTVQLRAVDAAAWMSGASVNDASTYASLVAASSPWGWWRMRETKWPAGANAMLTNDSSGNRRHARHNATSISLGGAPIVGASPSVNYPRSDSLGIYTAVSGGNQLYPPPPPFSVELWIQFDNPPTSLFHSAVALASMDDPLLFCMMAGIQTPANACSIAIRLGLRFDDPSNSKSIHTDALWIDYTDDPQYGDGSNMITGLAYTLQRPVGPMEQSATPFYLFDGQPHHLVYTVDTNFPASTAGAHLYIDGTEYSAWGIAGNDAPLRSHIGTVWTVRWGEQLGGRMAEVAVYPTQLSGATVLAHYNAGHRDWAGDTAGQRIGHILDGAGWPTVQRDLDAGRTKMSMVEMSTTPISKLADQAALSDGGLFYISALGRPTFRSRRSLATDTRLSTSQITFTDIRSDVVSSTVHAYVMEGFGYNVDRSLLRNISEAKATDPSIDSYLASNAASITAQGPVGDSESISTMTRTDLVAMAETKVANYKDPTIRVSPLAVFPDDRPSALRATGWQKLLDLDLGYAVTVKRTPRTGSVISMVSRIEHIEHEITASAWRVRLETSGRQPNETIWVLGTGALGTSTPLAW